MSSTSHWYVDDAASNNPMLDDINEGVPIILVHTDHEGFLLIKRLISSNLPIAINSSKSVKFTLLTLVSSIWIGLSGPQLGYYDN